MFAGVLAAAAFAFSCPATPVNYGVIADEPDATTPWIAAGPGRRRLVGHLYVYSQMLADARVRMSPGLVLYAGREAKIGWMPRSWLHDWGRYLAVEGRRLDAPGHFRQRFNRALRPQFYPSGVKIPSTGCWRLTLRSGQRQVTVVAHAIESPGEPRCDLTPWSADGVRASPRSSGIVASWGWRTPDGGALMYAGGRTPEGGNTNVLWRAERSHGEWIDIFGDGRGSFSQRFPSADSPGVFPSIVVVPEAGCWILTVRTGRVGGVIVFRGVVP